VEKERYKWNERQIDRKSGYAKGRKRELKRKREAWEKWTNRDRQ
jgi:hypothetical protein